MDPFDALLKDKNDTPADTETPTTSQAERINALDDDDDDDHNADQVDGEPEEEHTGERSIKKSSFVILQLVIFFTL